MRKFKENILKILLYLSAIITVGILVFIIGFIFIKGYKLINLNYLFGDYKPSGGGGIKPFIISTLYTVGIIITYSNTNRSTFSCLLTRVCKARKAC